MVFHHQHFVLFWRSVLLAEDMMLQAHYFILTQYSFGTAIAITEWGLKVDSKKSTHLQATQD